MISGAQSADPSRSHSRRSWRISYSSSPISNTRRAPGSSNPTTTVLTSEAQSGIYRFVGTDGLPHTIDVLQLAAGAGYIATIDPTVAAALQAINGTLSNGNRRPSNSNLFQEIAAMAAEYRPARHLSNRSARLSNSKQSGVARVWNLRHNHNDGGGPPYPGSWFE